MDGFAYVILAIATLAIAWVLTVVFFKKAPIVEEDLTTKDTKKSGNANGESAGAKKQGDVKKGGTKQGKSKSSNQQGKEKDQFTHTSLISTLKGHTGKVLDMDLSPNNKFLASCADDRTVYLWFTKDFSDKDHKSIRVNIPFDYATYVRWSPDSKAFVIARNEEKVLEVYKLGRKPDNSIGNITSALQWPQNCEIPVKYVGVGIACNGKFVMSCTEDAYVVLREPKGTVLKIFLPPITKATEAKISPCGRYVSISGSDEIAVYDVQFDPASGQFKDALLKWKLKIPGGSLVVSTDFSTDSSKLAVICESGSWFIYDTTGSRVNVETKGTIDVSGGKPRIALSGDARVFVVGTGGSVFLFSTFSGNQLDAIENAHSKVKCVNFSADGKYLLTAGDSFIRVFHNVSWYKETIKSLKGQLQDSSVTASMRNRLSSESAAFEQELEKKGLTANFS